MSYVILRTTKLKSMGNIGGSLAHNYRTRDTPNAVTEREHLNSHELAGPEEVKAAIAARLPEKRRSDAVLCVEYMISASPAYFTDGPDKDGSAYFASVVKWLEAKHGAENVVSTTIHRDESSPHLVAYVVPLDDQGKLNAKAFLGGKAKLSAMQTEFAQQVGLKHGLERGLEGSKATHTSIREYYGRVGRAQDKTPSVDVPDPSMGDRVNPKAYGNRVAQSILQQMAPELRALRAKAVELDGAKREAKETRVALADQSKRLAPILKALGPLTAQERVVLASIVQRTSDKIQADRAAKAQQQQQKPAPVVKVDKPSHSQENDQDR